MKLVPVYESVHEPIYELAKPFWRNTTQRS
jgi:hypothetical protein